MMMASRTGVVKIRVEGAALLILCALTVYRLHAVAMGLRPDAVTPGEMGLGLVVVMAGMAGAAMLVVGRPLFRPYVWPPKGME